MTEHEYTIEKSRIEAYENLDHMYDVIEDKLDQLETATSLRVVQDHDQSEDLFDHLGNNNHLINIIADIATEMRGKGIEALTEELQRIKLEMEEI